jgi:hypothetical protein
MSYGKIVVGLGIALTILLALSAGITLVAMQAQPNTWASQAWGMHGMGWGMMRQAGVTVNNEDYEYHCPMMEGGFRKGKLANLTTISGTVEDVDPARGFIVVATEEGDYNVYIKGMYVRTDDGVLVFGGWILGNIEQGELITVKRFTRNNNLVAVEIEWRDHIYQTPAYYMYILKSG